MNLLKLLLCSTMFFNVYNAYSMEEQQITTPSTETVLSTPEIATPIIQTPTSQSLEVEEKFEEPETFYDVKWTNHMQKFSWEEDWYLKAVKIAKKVKEQGFNIDLVQDFTKAVTDALEKKNENETETVKQANQAAADALIQKFTAEIQKLEKPVEKVEEKVEVKENITPEEISPIVEEEKKEENLIAEATTESLESQKTEPSEKTLEEQWKEYLEKLKAVKLETPITGPIAPTIEALLQN